MDAERNLGQFQKDMLLLQEDEQLKKIRDNCCLFNQAKMCNHCFSCIGLLNQKDAQELTAFETMRLLDYKLYRLNLDEFATKVNNIQKERRAGILYSMNRNTDGMLTVTTGAVPAVRGRLRGLLSGWERECGASICYPC